MEILKETYCQRHYVIFPMSEQERLFVAKRQLQNTKRKNAKINCKTTGGVPSQMKPNKMQEDLAPKNYVNATLQLHAGDQSMVQP